MKTDFARALVFVWFALSLIAGATVLAAFALPPEVAHGIFPVCESVAHSGRSCPACGLTTAFLDIAHARWQDAHRANAAAIPLFALFSLNSPLALLAVARRIRTGDRSCKS